MSLKACWAALSLMGGTLCGSVAVLGPIGAQAWTLGPPIVCPFCGICRKHGGPIDRPIGRRLGQASLIDSTHAGQLHLAYVDYFAGTAMASALYARQPEATQVVVAHGAAQPGIRHLHRTRPVGVETGSFSASDVAWVSGISVPLDTNLTCGRHALGMGQSGLG